MYAMLCIITSKFHNMCGRPFNHGTHYWRFKKIDLKGEHTRQVPMLLKETKTLTLGF